MFGIESRGAEGVEFCKFIKNNCCAGSGDFNWKLVSGRGQTSALGTQAMVPAVLVDTGHNDYYAGVAAAGPFVDHEAMMNS